MTGVIGGQFADGLLVRLGRLGTLESFAYRARGNKLERAFGPGIWKAIAGKAVLDFGCGPGLDVIEIARRGAPRTIGLDPSERALQAAREGAKAAGLADRCTFVQDTTEVFDVVLSLDTFDHYNAPEDVLRQFRARLSADGRVYLWFGPPWFHPLGGHLFSFFPWAHLIFSEAALCRWRARFKTDGAKRFSEVEGGLNQMTIRRFRRIVARSPFRFEMFETVPIRGWKLLSTRLTREFTTAVVRCVLVPREAGRGTIARD